MKAYLWTIEGTKRQQELVKDALRAVTFPFQRIRKPIPKPLIRFRDLSKWNEGKAKGEDAHLILHPKHAGAAGLFWHDGRIVIDEGLPDDYARSIIVAEMAHLVDSYMPLTKGMRKKLSNLMGGKGIWWGGDDYYAQDGEAFMMMFIAAYSPFDYSGWPRPVTPDMAPKIRQILKVKPVKAPQ